MLRFGFVCLHSCIYIYIDALWMTWISYFYEIKYIKPWCGGIFYFCPELYRLYQQYFVTYYGYLSMRVGIGATTRQNKIGFNRECNKLYSCLYIFVIFVWALAICVRVSPVITMKSIFFRYGRLTNWFTFKHY